MKQRGILLALALVLATVAVYVPAMNGGFVWDDDDYVTNNPLLIAPDGLRRIWFSFDSPSQYFPLTYTSFRIERSLWALRPRGYHVTNVLLHAANALLVWLLLRRLALPGAWLAAALFAIHPVHVESVAWITERKNVLSTLFSLLTVLAWTRFLEGPEKRRRRHFLLGLGWFWLALFSKTTACTLPAGLLIICWLKGESIGRRRLLQVAPFAVSGVAMGLVSLWWERFHQGTQGQQFAFSIAERLIIAGRAFWFYLGKLFWPAELSFSYTRWTIDSGSPEQYLWPIAALAGTFALWHWRKTLGRGPAAAILFFVASLAPLLGFFSLYTFRYTFVADHYQYVASLGPLALVAALAGKWWRGQSRGAYVTIVLCAAVLLALGALTWKQGGVYRDAETLWRDTLAKNPGSFMAHSNAGLLSFERGDLSAALVHQREAIRLHPGWEEYYNMGNTVAKLGRIEEALACYRESLRQRPSAMAYTNMGIELYGIGRRAEAFVAYREALKLKPDFFEAHYNLGLDLIKQGSFAEALPNLREAVRLAPEDPDAHQNLGVVLGRLGQEGEAKTQSEAAAQLRNAAERPRF